MVAYRRLDLLDSTTSPSKVASHSDHKGSAQGLATLEIETAPAIDRDELGGVPSSNVDVVDYYRETVEDYLRWSPKGYMHFGFWQPGTNPLDRNAMLEAMNDLVFEALRLEKPDRSNSTVRSSPMTIADLGCGLGAVSNYGSEKFPNHRFKAFTVSQEQVNFGRTMLANDRATIDIGNFHELPLEDNSIDAAFFLESICHSQTPELALAEAKRVLKPGGRLVVVDGLLNQTRERTSSRVKRLAGIVADNWAVPDFHALPDFHQAIDQAGLIVEDAREIGWNIVPCVAHSPWLVGTHAIKLALRGELTAWKRKHLIACGLGVVLGMHRWSFGYHVLTMQKPA